MLINRIVGNTDTNFVSYGSRYIAEVRKEREKEREAAGEKTKRKEIMEIPRKSIIIRLQ